MFYPNLGETKNKPVDVGTRGPGIGHPEAHPPHLPPSLSLGLGLYTHRTSGLVPLTRPPFILGCCGTEERTWAGVRSPGN